MQQELMQTQPTQDKKYVNTNSPLQLLQQRQFNKVMNENNSRQNSPINSLRDKSKHMSIANIIQHQNEKSTSLHSQAIKTTNQNLADTNTNIQNASEDNQVESKTNTKLRTIFRGGIIGILGGKPRKRKVLDKRKNKQKDIESEENNLQSLFFALEQLSRIERQQKAMRHFRDSLSLKPVRHDIELNEGWLIPTIYFWQTSPSWQSFLFIIGILFPMASFVEPANMYVKDYADNSFLLIYEFILLSFVWVDIGFEYFHRYFDKDKSLKEHYLLNLKLSTRTLIGSLLLIDLLVFHLSFPILTYRFSRYLRPFLVFYYSLELRRTLISIMKSMKQITQLVIFISALTFFIAIIGWRFIGNLDNPAQYDQYSLSRMHDSILQQFKQFQQEALNLPNNYLKIISIEDSPYYALYFVIYCTLLILILIPIPVSVVYDSFRTHRSKLVLIDRIKQREALLSCFISLDFNNQKSIDYKVFHDFMASIYLQRKRYIKRIKPLYQCIDQNESMSISMNEFFDIIDVMERNPQFQIPDFRDNKYWDRFRVWLNGKIDLKSKVKSGYFDLVMIIVLLSNCAILFVGMTTSDQDTIAWTDECDDYFFYVYIIEFFLKLIGIGIEKYFEDSWNMFDFSLVLISFMSLVLSTTLSFLKNAKSAKATKLLRLTKINRVFRIFKALRSFKFLSFLFAGVEVFYQVKLLIQKIFMCLPIVLRLVPIILMLFYIYTYIALENFNTDTFAYIQNSPYDSGYVSFTSFHEGMLIFFQIMLESNWSAYIYDISYKFNQPYLANFIFISFDFIIQFILLSLIKGIVWEVFTVVNEEIKYQEHLTQQRNESSKFTKMKDQNNKIFLKKANMADDKDDNFEKKITTNNMIQNKSVFKTNQFIQDQNVEGDGNNPQSNLTSEFRGIMLYEKILRNLGNISLNNSYICNEGQIPDSPKLNGRQQTCMKETEESTEDREIISEHKQMILNSINQTKQIQTSPQKYNTCQTIEGKTLLNNSPTEFNLLQEDSNQNEGNLQLENQQIKDASDKIISETITQQNNEMSKSPPTKTFEYDQKRYMSNVYDCDERFKQRPSFSTQIIQKSHIIKSKSMQQQSNMMSLSGGKLVKTYLSLLEKNPHKISEKDGLRDKTQYKEDINYNNQNQNQQQEYQQKKINRERQSDENIEIGNDKNKINEENDNSMNSQKLSFQMQNKIYGDQVSFFQNQDSSISEYPLKSDINMKSYIDGPIIFRQVY